MRVRVFDEKKNLTFQSEVYATVNSGQMLVRVPDKTGDYFALFDSVDLTGGEYRVLIQMVLPQKPETWVLRRCPAVKEKLAPYGALLSPETPFWEYRGFPWLLEDTATLTRLLEGENIPLRGSVFEGKLYSDLSQPGWTDVLNQADADALRMEVSGFHDSVLSELRYISGSYVGKDNFMHPFDEVRSVRAQFQSQICGSFELEFLGVTAMNLRPTPDGYTSEIFGAALFIRDESVFFYDYDLEEPDPDYNGTWINAYGLRWRFLH